MLAGAHTLANRPKEAASIALFLTSIIAAIVTEMYWLPLIPLGFLCFLYLLTSKTESLYYVAAATIPFSTELDLPGGIGLVFPGELMLLLLTGITVIIVLANPPPKAVRNPITVVLLLHLFWIGFTSLFAEYPIISVKYLLAKVWFVLPYYVLPFYILNRQWTFDKFLKIIVWASFIAGIYVFVMHGMEGWSFASRTTVGKPFFRNHVNYACLLLMMIPAGQYLYKSGYGGVYRCLTLCFLVFIYVTYARIAYVAVVAMMIMYVVYRFNIIRLFLAGSIIVIGLSLSYMLSGDRLLHYAPDYESTVSHQRFDRLIEATYQFKDISAMERAYRWMAGLNMIQERPIIGFGPSNFYSCYQEYSISSFQTYVSDNPERSGIHNYYLMLVVEQGVVGLMLFLSLIFMAFWKIAFLRKTATSDVVQLAMFWLVIAIVILLLNDMVEVIKFGPFVFLSFWLVGRLGLDDHIDP